MTTDFRRSATTLRIFLIGLMGSGKTTVGTQLAGRLGCAYFDNDALLLASHGATAETLAAAIGADALHARESQQLRDLVAAEGPFVASIAASAGDRPADLKLLSSSGYVVYLRALPDTLVSRVGAGAGRPWLRDDPATVIRRMFETRDDAYRQCAADIFDCDEIGPAAIVEAIVSRLGSIHSAGSSTGSPQAPNARGDNS